MREATVVPAALGKRCSIVSVFRRCRRSGASWRGIFPSHQEELRNGAPAISQIEHLKVTARLRRSRFAVPAGDILQVIADSRVDMEGRMRGMLGFLFYSSIALAPALTAVSVAGHFLRRDRLIGLARVAVVIGFLAGGGVGWASVPAQWTASLWTTIEAAGNSASTASHSSTRPNVL